MPFVTPLTYFFLLPRPRAFEALPLHLFDDEPIGAPATSPYAPIPTGEDDAVVSGSTDDIPLPAKHIALSIADKLVLLRPMLHKYMLPLCEFLSV
jgi:battenin